jgi:Zn-finger nucleic acid-binding protein
LLCSLCLGVWVDEKELYDILNVPPDTITVTVSNEAKVCPKCGTHGFYPVNFPETDVVIDICKGCKGIWFYMGELQTIKASVQKRMKEKSDKPETASERVAAWVNNIIADLKAE